MAPIGCLQPGGNIEVVQLPNNTTHFLQSNDQDTNLTLNRAVRASVNYVAIKDPYVNVGDMGMQLKLGVAGFRALETSVITVSWERVGMWPMDFRFVRWVDEN